MIDESMDKEQMKLPAQPYEFRAKPAWQRLIIMIGGVVVNVILAIVIFIGITWVWGEELLPAKNVKYGMHADSLAKSIGIREGDNIVSIDGKPVEDVGLIVPEIVTTDAKKIQVLRKDSLINIALPDGLIRNLYKAKKGKALSAEFVTMRYPVIVDSVAKTAVFTKGRFQRGDQLIGLNGKSFQYFHEYDGMTKGYADSIVTFTLLRGQDTVDVKVLLNNKGSVGFSENALRIIWNRQQAIHTGTSDPIRCRQMF